MIVADTNIVIHWLQGDPGPDVDQLDDALGQNVAWLAPVSIAELFSDKAANAGLAGAIGAFRLVTLSDGYWRRAGEARAKVRQAGRKAALGDALIAQACIDAQLPLLTRDADFGAFAQHCGLTLA